MFVSIDVTSFESLLLTLPFLTKQKKFPRELRNKFWPRRVNSLLGEYSINYGQVWPEGMIAGGWGGGGGG
jgi:hypothetical protein